MNTETQTLIDSIAAKTGTSAHTVEMLARQVANRLKQDKAADYFEQASEADQVAVAAAYVQPALNSIRGLVHTYLTNANAAQALREYVYSQVAGAQS